MDKGVQMKWIWDIDGVITSNPDFFKWFSYQLKKKMNENEIIILTSRNPDRKEETINELRNFGISYDSLEFMPKELARDPVTQARWKKDRVIALNPDVWFDNDFKWYEYIGVSVKDLKCNKILI